MCQQFSLFFINVVGVITLCFHCRFFTVTRQFSPLLRFSPCTVTVIPELPENTIPCIVVTSIHSKSYVKIFFMVTMMFSVYYQ